MKTKTCSTCKLSLPIDCFRIIKSSVRNGKQRYSHSASCDECLTDRSMFKTCKCCGKKLPKTEEYFHKKVETKIINESIHTCVSFRHFCKECLNNKYAAEKRDRYWDDPDKGRALSRAKYARNPDPPRARTTKWRQLNIEYLLEKDRKRVRELEDTWVASKLRIPIKECPRDILETEKLLIQIKRVLKENK